MKHKSIALTAITAAVICIFSPFSLPLGAIPLSLATFAIFIIACISPPGRSVAAVLIYILIGAAGLPVFSGFIGGFQQITGVTGGYIIGYIPCAFTVSFLTNQFKNSKTVFPVSMTLGTLVCYLCGTVWYSLYTDTPFATSLTICVLPFVAGDIIKISAASAVGIILKKRLNKYI
ncbi:MAG: biotin transporter BioY [Clostridia bacterium]|nr:biotin transporter BioY [Clostridia bacterium]